MVSNLEARGEHRWLEGWVVEMAAKEETRQEATSEPVPGEPRSRGLGCRGQGGNKVCADEKAL